MITSKRVAFFLLCMAVLLVPTLVWNSTLNAGLIKFFIARTVILLISGVLLFNVFRTGKIVYPGRKTAIVALVLLLYTAAVCLHNRLSDWIFYGDLALSILLLFEAYILLDSKRKLVILFTLWHAGALIVMLYYLLQLTGNDFLAWTSPELVGSTYINRNALAYYLLCTFPYTLILLMHSRKWGRILPCVSLVLFLLIAIFSPSRGMKAVLVFFIFLTLLFSQKRLKSPRLKKLTRTATLVVSGLLLLGCVVLLYRIGSEGYQGINRFTHNRVLIVKETIPVVASNIWFGYGANTFAKVFRKYCTREIGFVFPFRDPLYNSHNEILELLFEYGIVGVVLMALFLIFCIGTKFRFRKNTPFYWDLLFFSALSCTGCFLLAQLVSIAHFLYCTFFSWLSLAILSRRTIKPQTFKLPKGRASYILLTGIILWWALSGFFIYRYVQNFRSEMYVCRASRFTDPSKAPDTVSRLLEKALQYNPENPFVYYQRAYIAILQNRYDDALADYAIVERTDPYMINLHFNKGVVYYRQGEYGKAIPLFLESTRLFPLFLEPVYYLAKAYSAEGIFDHSLHWCKYLQVYAPGNKQYIKLYNEVVARKNKWSAPSQ
jgi:O-antigen ligase